MTTPDLLYSEVEDDLRENVRRLLQDRCDWPDVLARCETEQPYDLPLWRTLADDLGLAGLLIPEELGGQGASSRELAVLAEELGRSVAPVPFLGSVLASVVAIECSPQPAVTELLPGIIDGTLIATVAVGLTTQPAAGFPDLLKASSSTLTGTVRAVVDLDIADRVLTPAVDEDGPALYVVDTAESGVRCHSLTTLDLTRRIGELELDGAQARRIASGDTARNALRRSLVTAAGILASEQTGLAQRCLDSTVDYVLTRQQFGRQIGSFQAVKHRLAELWSGVSAARAVARNAADSLAKSEETELAVAVAQAHCSDLVVSAAEEALQLHGGIGMTWEHPTHLYLGRAKSSQLTFGIAERHRDRIAELTGLAHP